MHKPYHAPLDDGHLDTWATYIEEKTATIFYPPRIPEFDNVILEPLLKKYKPTSASIAESSIPPVNPGLLREVHYNYIPNDNRRHKRRKESDSDTSNASPIKRRKRKNYDTSFSSSYSSDHSPLRTASTLSPLQHWCKSIYRPEYSLWDEAFDMLRKNDVGLDSFSKKIKSSKLVHLCHSSALKEATADRLIRAHKKWIKKGKPAGRIENS